MDSYITMVSVDGRRQLPVKEAKPILRSIDARNVYDYHKVINTLSPNVPLSDAICISYIGKNRDTRPLIADLTKRIIQKQIKLAILVYRRSFQAETIGTKAWVISNLLQADAFYDDAPDHLFSSFTLCGDSLRIFLVRSGGLSEKEVAKTSAEFSAKLTHVPSLIHHVRGDEPGARKTTMIHRLLYSNAALMARAFVVTLTGPSGNQLQNSYGETINVLHSDEGMSYIVYEKSERILFHRYYQNRKDFQDTAKDLIKYIQGPAP